MKLAQPKLYDNGTKIRICARLSYANLFTPRTFAGQQDPAYSTALLIDKNDTETIEVIRMAIDTATEQGKMTKWSGKIPAKFHNPLRDGDIERPDDENYAGHYFMNAKTKADSAPQVVLRHKDPKTGKPIPADESDVYSGCYCNVSLSLYPYSVSGNNGVGVGLGNVQKWEDGERLAGRATAESDFDFDEPEEVDLLDDWNDNTADAWLC